MWFAYLLNQLLAQDTPAIPPQAVEVVEQTTVAVGLTMGQRLLTVLYIVVCVALIAAILARTTKSEGLSGSMMGPAETVFRGKKSAEDNVSMLTNALAVTFLLLSVVVSFSFPS